MTDFHPATLSGEDIRDVLLLTLTYHQRYAAGACACGWSAWGDSYPDHVADVFEESLLAHVGYA